MKAYLSMVREIDIIRNPVNHLSFYNFDTPPTSLDPPCT